MAFLLRVFSKGREVPPEVDQIRGEFSDAKDELSSTLAQNADVRAFIEMIFETSDEETQYFILSPSSAWLREKEQLVFRVFAGFSAQGLSFFERLSSVIQQHGVEPVADIALHVFKLLSNQFVTKYEYVDSLPEHLDFGWQLASPLSRKPKICFYHQQFTSRHDLHASSPLQDHEGANTIAYEKVTKWTNSDKVARLEEEPIKPNSREDVQDTSVQEQEDLAKQDEVSRTSPEAANSVVSCEVHTDNSSRVHSRRMSYGGSELYTTDSDDDSLSTSSHMSMLVAVAVSEVQESDSSSENDSDHLVGEHPPNATEAGHAFNHGDEEEPVEDKLPIHDKNRSLENESFYTPEMWTYSDKDTGDLESFAVGETVEDGSISSRKWEQEEEIVEEVKVVIEASYTDKFVSVSFKPVSTFKSMESLTSERSSSPDSPDSPDPPDPENSPGSPRAPVSETQDTVSFTVMPEEQEVQSQMQSESVKDSQEATEDVEDTSDSSEALRDIENGETERKTADVEMESSDAKEEKSQPSDVGLSTEKSETATTKGVSSLRCEETEAPVIPHSGDQISSYSGTFRSLSVRSDSSTTSARSFAFPIYSSEWMSSSPVKMATPDRRYVKHAKHSWSRSLCCFYSCSCK